MGSRSAPLIMPDKVTVHYLGEIRAEWREGELDHPVKVNIYPDAFGRTLLAWYGLQAIPYFMP